MPLRLILQGFRAETHQAALVQLLRTPSIERVVISVAFLSLKGVELVADDLTALGERVSIFAGIRNGITSKQGLCRLLTTGVELFAVDTGARGLIYHPKLYLGRSTNEARLLVGSANLTVGGLHNNIEAGIEMTLDLTCPTDRAIQQATEDQFDELPGAYPQNVIRVTTVAEIDDLVASGRLVDEHVPIPTRSTNSTRHQSADNVPRMQLVVHPRRVYVPPITPDVDLVLPSTSEVNLEAESAWNWTAVWRSKNLTKRDLNIPSRPTTHLTGSINLDKGLLSGTVDHRHYFRETVFHALPWIPKRSGTIEEAVADFRLVVRGLDYGSFPLKISHTTSTTSTSYLQRNAMTRLQWGLVKDYVAHPHMLNSLLTLFMNKTDPKKFLIEID